MSDELALGYAMGQDNNNCCNNGGGMWGGDNWILGLAALGLVFGGGFGFGGFGGGGGALNGVVTRAELADSFNFNNLDNAVRGVQQGLCDGFYAMNTGILNGFAGVNNAICDLGYATQQGFNTTNVALMQGFNGVQAGQAAIGNQIAGCCCDIREQIGQVRYDMATDTCAIQNTIQNAARDIIDNQNATTRSIYDFLVSEKLATKDARIADLSNQLSQSQQNAVIRAAIDASTAEILRRSGHDCPSAAYLVQPPTPVNFPVNGCGTVQFGNGYGCGGGCCA